MSHNFCVIDSFLITLVGAMSGTCSKGLWQFHITHSSYMGYSSRSIDYTLIHQEAMAMYVVV